MKRLIAILATFALIFGTAAKCEKGTPSNPDRPSTFEPQGPPSCTVDGRGQNSKGLWYLHYTCTDGQGGARILIGPDDLPKCIVGTFWDNCAK